MFTLAQLGAYKALSDYGVIGRSPIKVAYDINDAMRVGRAAKKYVLSAPDSKALIPPRKINFAGKLETITPTAHRSPKSRLAGVTRATNTLETAAGMPLPHFRNSEMKWVEDARDSFENAPSIARQGYVDRGMINPGSPKVPTQFAQRAGVTKLAPDQHIMLNSIFRGHELDELKVTQSPSFRRFGHDSPDVILREHNRLATMPEGFEPVLKTMQGLRTDVGRKVPRSTNEAAVLSQYGIQYGESPRLSRHARRRIVETMERDELPGRTRYAIDNEAKQVLRIKTRAAEEALRKETQAAETAAFFRKHNINII